MKKSILLIVILLGFTLQVQGQKKSNYWKNIQKQVAQYQSNAQYHISKGQFCDWENELFSALNLCKETGYNEGITSTIRCITELLNHYEYKELLYVESVLPYCTNTSDSLFAKIAFGWAKGLNYNYKSTSIQDAISLYHLFEDNGEGYYQKHLILKDIEEQYANQKKWDSAIYCINREIYLAKDVGQDTLLWLNRLSKKTLYLDDKKQYDDSLYNAANIGIGLYNSYCDFAPYLLSGFGLERGVASCFIAERATEIDTFLFNQGVKDFEIAYYRYIKDGYIEKAKIALKALIWHLDFTSKKLEQKYPVLFCIYQEKIYQYGIELDKIVTEKESWLYSDVFYKVANTLKSACLTPIKAIDDHTLYDTIYFQQRAYALLGNYSFTKISKSPNPNARDSQLLQYATNGINPTAQNSTAQRQGLLDVIKKIKSTTQDEILNLAMEKHLKIAYDEHQRKQISPDSLLYFLYYGLPVSSPCMNLNSLIMSIDNVYKIDPNSKDVAYYTQDIEKRVQATQNFWREDTILGKGNCPNNYFPLKKRIDHLPYQLIELAVLTADSLLSKACLNVAEKLQNKPLNANQLCRLTYSCILPKDKLKYCERAMEKAKIEKNRAIYDKAFNQKLYLKYISGLATNYKELENDLLSHVDTKDWVVIDTIEKATIETLGDTTKLGKRIVHSTRFVDLVTNVDASTYFSEVLTQAFREKIEHLKMVERQKEEFRQKNREIEISRKKAIEEAQNAKNQKDKAMILREIAIYEKQKADNARDSLNILRIKSDSIAKKEAHEKMRADNKTTEATLARLRAEKSEKIAWGLVLLSFILFLFAICTSRRNQKLAKELVQKNKFLNEANEKLAVQGAELLNKNQALVEANQRIQGYNQNTEHRILNTFTVIMNVLSRRIEIAKEEAVKLCLENVKQRLGVFKDVHLVLRSLKQYERVQMSSLLNNISQSIIDSYSSLSNIRSRIMITDNIYCKGDIAKDIAIVVSEFISNSCKHAFTNQNSEPEVFVYLSALNENTYTLTIGDNGIGFPSKVRDTNGWDKIQTSLGLYLIHSFSDALRGELSLNVQNGSTLYINLPSYHFHI